MTNILHQIKPSDFASMEKAVDDFSNGSENNPDFKQEHPYCYLECFVPFPVWSEMRLKEAVEEQQQLIHDHLRQSFLVDICLILYDWLKELLETSDSKQRRQAMRTATKEHLERLFGTKILDQEQKLVLQKKLEGLVAIWFEPTQSIQSESEILQILNDRIAVFLSSIPVRLYSPFGDDPLYFLTKIPYSEFPNDGNLFYYHRVLGYSLRKLQECRQVRSQRNVELESYLIQVLGRFGMSPGAYLAMSISEKMQLETRAIQIQDHEREERARSTQDPALLHGFLRCSRDQWDRLMRLLQLLPGKTPGKYLFTLPIWEFRYLLQCMENVDGRCIFFKKRKYVDCFFSLFETNLKSGSTVDKMANSGCPATGPLWASSLG